MRYIGAAPRLLQITALLAVFVLPDWQAEAMDKDGLAFVLGPGTRSCATWTDDANKRGDKGAFFSEMGWVDGFLSAYNAYEWRGKNISSETDLAARTAWLNNYCAANPTVNISAAADALVKFLAIGPHPNDK